LIPKNPEQYIDVTTAKTVPKYILLGLFFLATSKFIIQFVDLLSTTSVNDIKNEG
jgi:hypothetical protein